MFDVRVAQKADIPGIDAVLSASYPQLLKDDYPPSLLVTVIPRIARAQPALVTSGTYFVALIEGQIASVGGWTRARPGGGGSSQGLGHIRHFGTDPAHLRKGLAGAIMRRCLAEAREAGVFRLECYSTLTAERFYRHSGFQRVRPVEVDLGSGILFPSILMDQDLK